MTRTLKMIALGLVAVWLANNNALVRRLVGQPEPFVGPVL